METLAVISMEDAPLQRRKVLSQDCWEAAMTTLKAGQGVIAPVSMVLLNQDRSWWLQSRGGCIDKVPLCQSDTQTPVKTNLSVPLTSALGVQTGRSQSSLASPSNHMGKPCL